MSEEMHNNGIIMPEAVDVDLPENKYEFSRVTFAGISKKDKNSDAYQLNILEPEFMEREVPEFASNKREKPPLHIVHILTMIRDKIVETFDHEIALQMRKQQQAGTVDAEVEQKEQELPVRNANDLPSAIIAENVDEELKIAQSLDWGPVDKKAR